MEHIFNSTISIKAKKSGAELTSIVKDGVEYLWQADPSIWARNAPILFPIVGKLINNSCKIGDTTYQMSQHGFARDMDFEVINCTNNLIHYQLKYTAKTFEVYPYKFELNVIYSIENNQLKVEYIVNNIDTKPIEFSIGGHPAFNCPLLSNEKFEDYQLVFEQDEILKSRLVDLTNGSIQDIEIEVPKINNKVNISKTLFDNDALVFNNLSSKWVAILHKDTGKGVKMNIEQFPLLGIWAKKDIEKFVCLEPWQGLADHSNYKGQFADKEGIVKLIQKESWKAHYLIEII